MRTTITLTPDADLLVRRLMRERHLSFKDAVNEAILRGARSEGPRPAVHTPSFDLGRARVPLVRATAIAADFEDAELLRKREQGK